MASKGVDEDIAFREIFERMTTKYPEVAPAEIRKIVDAVRAELASAKVRDFVPVLAEREIKKRIKQTRE